MKKALILFLLFPFIVFSQEDLKHYEQYMPKSSCGNIINYNYYSASFCEKFKLSEWTIYYSTMNRLSGSVSRTNNFRQDRSLKGKDAKLSDYKYSGYDRGHLVPAGDMRFNEIAMSESFYMVNITPQEAYFNRGGFKELESKFRSWVFEFDTIIIISGWVTTDIRHYIKGDVYSDEPEDSFIPIPNYFYKVFIDPNNKRSIAFLLPNEKITKGILDYVVSIDYLESVTGLDFFYKLPKDIERSFEIDTGDKN